MNIIHFNKNKIKLNKSISFKVMILIKESGFSNQKIRKYYLPHIKKYGIKSSEVCCLPLIYDGEKRVKATTAKEYLLNNILPIAKELKIRVLLVADAQYFKFLTSKTMALVEQNYTNVIYADYSFLRVIPIINFMSFFANPAAKQKLHLNFTALPYAYENTLILNNKGEINNLVLAFNPKEFKKKLNKLTKLEVTVDIEAFSLQYYLAGLATISFSSDKETSLATYCDYVPKDVYDKYYSKEPIIKKYPQHKAYRINNKKIKNILYEFFKSRKGLHIYHNATFDTKIIIFEVFMNGDVGNIKGLHQGLYSVTENIEDTYILTYLAVNSCSKQPLDLKSNTAEYMGNYGIEVKDITVHSPIDILNYNAQDTIATYFLYEKHRNIPVQQDQQHLYAIYIDMIITTVQMEISGMGMDAKKVDDLYKKMQIIINEEYEKIQTLLITTKFNTQEAENSWIKKLKELKVKIPDISYFRKESKLNPNSVPQLSKFLFEYLKLPILDKTTKGNPSAKGNVLAKLLKLLK